LKAGRIRRAGFRRVPQNGNVRTAVATCPASDAPVNGTHLVVVGSAGGGFTGSGTYRLSLAKTPGAVTVSAGDEGGPLTNGGVLAGTIARGDLDSWTFFATAGDRIDVHISQLTEADDFRPWIRLLAPNGASLGSSFAIDAAAIGPVTAPITGTYLVLVGSADSGADGIGTYALQVNWASP
jgi:hypothetical protein